jgi:glycosyltransferase involved in cell wall biosynthesis
LILLVNELARLGIRQTIISRPGSPLEQVLLEMPRIRILSARSHLIDWITYGGASVFHAHEARAAYWAGVRGNLMRTPYIVTRRVINPLSMSRITRFIYRNAAEIVGVSEAVCRLTESDCGRAGLCIYDAHQELLPDPGNTERIRKALGGSPIIGQVAALVDFRKGQSASIAAFRIIKKRYPDAQLVLLGTGPDEERLRQLAERIEGVVFPGYRDDIADWMAALDLILHPSTGGALESSLLDAMHLGVPIVANRVGGIPEIARHNETALLVDLGDVNGLANAALRLLADAELRARLAEAGRHFADDFSPAAMAEAYLSLYRQIACTAR